MNGLKDAILQLYKENTSPGNIALKLGLDIDEVLIAIVGQADDERDKQRFAFTENKAYEGG